jgi:hypothetical protein
MEASLWWKRFCGVSNFFDLLVQGISFFNPSATFPPKARGRRGFGGGWGISGPSRARIARFGRMSQRYFEGKVRRPPAPAIRKPPEGSRRSTSEGKASKAARLPFPGNHSRFRGIPAPSWGNSEESRFTIYRGICRLYRTPANLLASISCPITLSRMTRRYVDATGQKQNVVRGVVKIESKRWNPATAVGGL